ncbi:MAG TPA: hypothetical protein VGO64_11800, partial [Candidatus Limnocylindrales bacterium]|nr:hypothetical protein [Candidatus Limnocylindrales bacterium]
MGGDDRCDAGRDESVQGFAACCPATDVGRRDVNGRSRDDHDAIRSAWKGALERREIGLPMAGAWGHGDPGQIEQPTGFVPLREARER